MPSLCWKAPLIRRPTPRKARSANSVVLLDRSTNNVLRVDTLLRRKDAWLVDVMGGRYAEHLTLARRRGKRK